MTGFNCITYNEGRIEHLHDRTRNGKKLVVALVSLPNHDSIIISGKDNKEVIEKGKMKIKDYWV
jgi:hypothetical protein